MTGHAHARTHAAYRDALGLGVVHDANDFLVLCFADNRLHDHWPPFFPRHVPHILLRDRVVEETMRATGETRVITIYILTFQGGPTENNARGGHRYYYTAYACNQTCKVRFCR